MAPRSRLAQAKYGMARSVTGAASGDEPIRPGASTTVTPPRRSGWGTAVSGPASMRGGVAGGGGGLTRLLEAVDQGAALDGDAAADRVEPVIGTGQPGRHRQVQPHPLAGGSAAVGGAGGDGGRGEA